MKKNKRLKIFVMLFFSIGLINSYILIVKNEPYDLSRTYGFVEYTRGSNDKEPFAKVFLSDGSDVSNIMIERGLLYEDCNVTKGFYGTCVN